MSNEAFLDDENRLNFVKNLKNYFELNLHTYDWIKSRRVFWCGF